MSDTYYIGDSDIHGKGVMAARNLRKDEIVGLGIAFRVVIPYVTPEFGSYINHSYSPTAYLWWYDGIENSEDEMGWYVRAIKPIRRDQEITVNYNDTPWYIEGALPHYV